MDTLTTVAVTVWLVVQAGTVFALWWRTRDVVRWSEVDRVKLTLAEQEEALASLFDKVNTMLARWRKREQRENEKRQEETSPNPFPPGVAQKVDLYRRARAQGSLNLRFPNLEANGVTIDQGSEGE